MDYSPWGCKESDTTERLPFTSSCSGGGAPLCCGVRASHCSGFPCRGAWARGPRAQWLQVMALELRLQSCGALA